MKKLIGHLKTVLTHKWYVFKYCCKLEIPWQGIVHDLSKFSPTEFSESVKYWTGTNSPIKNCKKHHNGFSKAWIHHRGRNLHHYEAWTDNYDSGHPIAHMMPWKYLAELVADYIAAGITYSKARGKQFLFQDEYEWWINGKRNTCLMHEETKRTVTWILKWLAACEGADFGAVKYIKEQYIKKYKKSIGT